MKEHKRVLSLDKYEHGIIVNALNDMRTKQIAEHRPTEPVDELLEKALNAPQRKFGVRVAEER